MRSYRENPEGEANQKASRENTGEVSRLQQIKEIKAAHAEQEKDEAEPEIQRDIPCPNCYGGHFRPCQWCCDTGRVDFIPNK